MRAREIKFRAWDKDENNMFDLDVFQNQTILKAKGRLLTFEEPYNESIVLMQYTGLKDKSKEEVYVDFIYVDSDGRFWQILDVGMCEGVWCYRMKPTDSKKEYPLDRCIERMYYYGNIYANPELLTTKQK